MSCIKLIELKDQNFITESFIIKSLFFDQDTESDIEELDLFISDIEDSVMILKDNLLQFNLNDINDIVIRMTFCLVSRFSAINTLTLDSVKLWVNLQDLCEKYDDAADWSHRTDS